MYDSLQEIEPFFSVKDISVVITDASEERIKAANLGTSFAPSPTTSLGTKSPSAHTVWSPLSVQDHQKAKFVAKSRIDTILEKAKEKQKAEKSFCDVLETAAKHNIKIWALSKVLAWLESLKARLAANPRLKHRPRSPDPTIDPFYERELKAPYIKYEAENQLSRPVIYEFRKFPKVYCGGRAGQSPFVAPVEVIQTYEPREAVKKSVAKKARSAKPVVPQGGYCEICEAPFSELEEHIISKVHIAKVGLSDLWKKLDTCIESVNLQEEFQVEASHQ